MLFGDMFYKKIQKLSTWQQNLFCLVLTTRMYPNFKLYCETVSNDNYKIFRQSIDTLWQYVEFHDEQIDLLEMQNEILEISPTQNNDSNLGEIAANYACQALLITIDSILLHTKQESLLASEKSINTVIRYAEIKNGVNFTDEEIVDLEECHTELDFQMELVELLNHKRSEEFFQKLKELADNDGYSNIGIKL